MKQLDLEPGDYGNRLKINAKPEDVFATCVLASGKILLLMKQPLWMRLYLFAGAAFLTGLSVWAVGLSWALVGVWMAGALSALAAILAFPRAILSDPEKPHHWQ